MLTSDGSVHAVISMKVEIFRFTLQDNSNLGSCVTQRRIRPQATFKRLVDPSSDLRETLRLWPAFIKRNVCCRLSDRSCKGHYQSASERVPARVTGHFVASWLDLSCLMDWRVDLQEV